MLLFKLEFSENYVEASVCIETVDVMVPAMYLTNIPRLHFIRMVIVISVNKSSLSLEFLKQVFVVDLGGLKLTRVVSLFVGNLSLLLKLYNFGNMSCQVLYGQI